MKKRPVRLFVVTVNSYEKYVQERSMGGCTRREFVIFIYLHVYDREMVG